jgi:hypothetical protein
MFDLRDYMSYNPETGQLFWIKKTHGVDRVGREVGSMHNAGYKQTRFDKKMYLCHHIAWYLYYGKWPVSELDHKDGDRLNNRIGNLREATRQQNQQNRVSREGSTSKYKGVNWDRHRNKWATYIKYDGKVHNLGRFDLEEEAAMKYNEYALKYFGEYARLNIIHPALIEEEYSNE